MMNIRKLDCSIEKYEDLADRKFEKDCDTELLDSWHVAGLCGKFDYGLYYYARAVVFGYIKRNPVDSYGINDFVKSFYKIHKKTLDKMGISPDCELDYNRYYNFNPSGVCGYEIWCDFNPSVVFSDVRVGLPGVNVHGHIVKRTDKGFEFVVIENSKEISHRTVSERRYKRFLRNLRFSTIYWDSYYHTRMSDGLSVIVRCEDINLYTNMFNAHPPGLILYRTCLVKWFGR